MHTNGEARRRFLAYFSGLGLGATLLPGVLWAQVQQEEEHPRHAAMLKDALALSGLTFSEEDQKAMLQGVNRNLSSYEEMRKLQIPNDVSPPFYFSSIMPGMKVNGRGQPLHFSTPARKAAGQSGGRGVLAGGAAGAAFEDPPGDVGGADADVSRRACTSTTTS